MVRLLVVGPDGSGKSSLAESLADALGPAQRGHYRLRVGPTAPAAQVFRPHEGPPPRSAALASLKLLRNWLAHNVADVVKVAGSPFVMERGWHDQLVDPQRYRLPKATRPLVKLLGRLTRPYDAVIICHGDSGKIHARKPELLPAEIERQLAQWNELAPTLAKWVITVDTTSNSEQQALEAVNMELLRRGWVASPLASAHRKFTYRRRRATCLSNIYQPASATGRLSLKLLPTVVKVAPTAEIHPLLAEACTRYPSYPFCYTERRDNGRIVAVVRSLVDNQQAVLKVAQAKDQGLARESRWLRDPALARLTPSLLAEGGLLSGRYLATALRQGTTAKIALASVIEAVAELQKHDVTHGDLTVWNVVEDKGRACLLDWEEATRPHEPFADLAHFCASLSTQAGRRGTTALTNALLAQHAQLTAYASTAGLPDWKFSLVERLEEQRPRTPHLGLVIESLKQS